MILTLSAGSTVQTHSTDGSLRRSTKPQADIALNQSGSWAGRCRCLVTPRSHSLPSQAVLHAVFRHVALGDHFPQ